MVCWSLANHCPLTPSNLPSGSPQEPHLEVLKCLYSTGVGAIFSPDMHWMD